MNVILITVDTLRADHLSCYGYWRKTSPNIDAFAEDGVCYERFFAQCSHTLPSFTSIMTGRTPFQTGVVATLHCVPDTPSGLLSDTVPTLAEILVKHQIHTYAVDNLMNFACHPSWFVRGFEKYLNPNPESFVANVLADRVNEVVFELLSRIKEPFFLWVHYWDPHRPYNQPGSYLSCFLEDDGDDGICHLPDGRGYIRSWGPLEKVDGLDVRDGDRVSGARDMIDAYDGEILYLDTRLGELFGRLESRGLYDRTAIFLTADHGESMAGPLTCFCHAEAIDACLWVPFIFKPLEKFTSGGGASERMATHTDIAPTILDLFGIPPRSEMEGRSLLKKAEDYPAELREYVISTGMFLLDNGIWKSIEVSVRTKWWRFVLRSELNQYPTEGLGYSKLWEDIVGLYRSVPRRMLIDTAEDPEGLTDRSAEYPELVEEFMSVLEGVISSPYFFRDF